MENRKNVILTEIRAWFIAGFFLVGLIMLCSGSAFSYAGYSSHTWPITKGEIVSVHVFNHVGIDGNLIYTPEIRYVYYVADIHSERDARYVNDRFSYDSSPSFPTQELAEVFLENYVVGETVDVYYDPDAPSGSVLKLSDYGHWFIPVTAGLVFMILASFLYVRQNPNTNGKEPTTKRNMWLDRRRSWFN